MFLVDALSTSLFLPILMSYSLSQKCTPTITKMHIRTHTHITHSHAQTLKFIHEQVHAQRHVDAHTLSLVLPPPNIAVKLVLFLFLHVHLRRHSFPQHSALSMLSNEPLARLRPASPSLSPHSLTPFNPLSLARDYSRTSLSAPEVEG
jgi:hypothetical protein